MGRFGSRYMGETTLAKVIQENGATDRVQTGRSNNCGFTLLTAMRIDILTCVKMFTQYQLCTDYAV